MTHQREKSLIGKFVAGGKESVAVRTLAEMRGPFRSAGKLSLHQLSGGRLFPDLQKYFGEKEDTPEPRVRQMYELKVFCLKSIIFLSMIEVALSDY